MVLDYAVDVIPLEGDDRILSYGDLGNFSVAGFEMVLQRHISHYLITYYLPSGILFTFQGFQVHLFSDHRSVCCRVLDQLCCSS